LTTSSSLSNEAARTAQRDLTQPFCLYVRRYCCVTKRQRGCHNHFAETAHDPSSSTISCMTSGLARALFMSPSVPVSRKYVSLQVSWRDEQGQWTGERVYLRRVSMVHVTYPAVMRIPTTVAISVRFVCVSSHLFWRQPLLGCK